MLCILEASEYVQQGRPNAYFHINEVINFFIVLMAMPFGCENPVSTS